MKMSVLKIHTEAWKIIRDNQMVQRDFALKTSISVYDDQPNGEFQPVEKVTIKYAHREYPMQIIASATSEDSALALLSFEHDIRKASLQIAPLGTL